MEEFRSWSFEHDLQRKQKEWSDNISPTHMNNPHPTTTHEWNIDALKERQLAIVLKDFVIRYEEAKKPHAETPVHETTLYCAAQAYLNETRR